MELIALIFGVGLLVLFGRGLMNITLFFINLYNEAKGD